MNLQTKFIESKGKPIKYENFELVQMDRIPINKGKVTVSFIEGNSDLVCGVAIKSPKGKITLTDGSEVELLHIWDEAGLPKTIAHNVNCPQGELRIWNIYRTNHQNGKVTEDSWTNNACMSIEVVSTNKRRYSCSDGLGKVDIKNQVFEVFWEEGK